MKITVYRTGNNETHDTALASMQSGLQKLGLAHPGSIKYLEDYDANNPDDISVVFGVYKNAVPDSARRGRVIKEQQAVGKQTIIIEKGYINRDVYYSVGFNGINGRADFKNHLMTNKRANLLDIKLSPYRKYKGDYILLIGQVPWDASVQHIDFEAWCNHVIMELKQYTDIPVVFRPHPLAHNKVRVGCPYSINESLDVDLANAYAVVTFNSTTGVESVIKGVPTFVNDIGSMAYHVANTNLEDICNPVCYPRKQWLADIAYTQWTLEEMEAGLPIKHLLRHELKELSAA